MKADPQVRSLLARAAEQVAVDIERALEEVVRSSRRKRSRHAAVLAIAAAAALIVLAIFLPRSSDDLGYFQGNPPTGHIAMIVRTQSESRLVGLDLATGDRTELSQGLGTPTAAQWSPDGKSVAFTVEEEDGARYALVVADADGSNVVKIVEHGTAEGTLGPDVISVAWSPDGSQLAYSGRTIFRGRTVTIVSRDGAEERVLEGHWESVSWSPDGKSLLLLGWPDDPSLEGRFDLYRANPDGSELRRLTDNVLRETHASWSPDASSIVFSRAVTAAEEDLNLDVYVMDADGSNVRQITDDESFDALPVWSPDGEWILFASDRDAIRPVSPEEQVGALSLYAMRPDGSAVGLVFSSEGSALIPLSWRRG
jgi:TolB protein